MDRTHSRKDFLCLAAGGMCATGGAMLAWPFIDQMNPSADVFPYRHNVDVSSVKPGQQIRITWQGKPVFIRRRTEQEIARAGADDHAKLPDPEPDRLRVQKPEWLIVVGVCTHFGCVPMAGRGDYDGWFCPCHGAHFDLSGRVRKGPAPRNLDIPHYEFLDEKTVRFSIWPNRR